ncbi:hypothetical protein SAMN05216474_0610 [Lishizhenia tianjinensis]|uniref:NADAR domain-containing protein n=1 Tax=Lishizhenia tianjinensis TaxID=477690 RepID=A0A1I6Y1S0_9FLAO|nr:NADAR family protein [Lishizhenia tianjinensis]SFT44565.1 hypothetical protein SAMN05216474_0610 [Lishizhenia tianjinensis]
MKSLNELITAFDEGQKLKFLYFWGHQPSRDGSVSSSCFSQWWKCSFTHENQLFTSTEQWMMYHKSLLFKDEEIAQKIQQSKSPGEAKDLGRQVRGFDIYTWEEKRFDIVVQGNLLKFSQNEDLKTFLLNTPNRVLVEASPVDEIWGIGLTKDSEKAQNPHTWRGLNLLGFALMETRRILNS